MTCEEYLSNMKPGYIVDAGSEEHLVMHELSQRALKITMELNNKYHTKEEIVQLMSELTGQKIDESFGIFPPFYTDCGRNIHIGKNVFINAGCKFQDQGAHFFVQKWNSFDTNTISRRRNDLFDTFIENNPVHHLV